MAEGGSIAVDIEVDAAALRRELIEAERLSRRFGSALGDALQAGVVRGDSLSEVLRGLAARLSDIALSAALRPVENAFGSLFSGLTKGLFGGVGATGFGAPAGLRAGFSAAPERAGSAAAPAPAPVTVNIATQDAESFRRAEAQVSAALARAVARGRRGL